MVEGQDVSSNPTCGNSAARGFGQPRQEFELVQRPTLLLVCARWLSAINAFPGDPKTDGRLALGHDPRWPILLTHETAEEVHPGGRSILADVRLPDPPSARLRNARELCCRKRSPAPITQGRRILEAAPRSSFSQDPFVVRAAFHSFFALTAYAHCCPVLCGTAQRQLRRGTGHGVARRGT